MNIVFFGTGEFSTKILKGLIDDNQNVIAVVSQPDKVNGRNNKIKFSKIKEFCLSNNIPLFQFEKVSRDGEDELKKLNADMFVTASFGQILKQNILDIPPLGVINVHASLLPKYRGSSPIQWAIMNGEKYTGITIMRTDIGLDTGDIYFSKKIDIDDNDTSSSVFNKLAILGVECLHEFFENYDYYKDKHFPQDEKNSSYYPMIKKEDFKLDFNLDAKTIFNKIRALEKCYFIYNSIRYIVGFANIVNMKGKVGEILSCDSKNGLVIACKEQAIKVKLLQPEGKQMMQAESFMNSKKFVCGDIIENS